MEHIQIARAHQTSTLNTTDTDNDTLTLKPHQDTSTAKCLQWKLVKHAI